MPIQNTHIIRPLEQVVGKPNPQLSMVGPLATTQTLNRCKRAFRASTKAIS